MNNVSIFYSWQSDKPETHTFIEKALETAIAHAGAALHLKIVLDQDSRDESGSPRIADSVQGKIRRAAVFVADLTIIAQRETRGGLPNGCVSIEWGWAEEALGSGALIGVMNTHYGGPSDLPVDIRQNLVRAKFQLSEQTSDVQREAESRTLAALLEKELIDTITQRFFRGFHPEAPRIVQYLVTQTDPIKITFFSPADLSKATGVSEETAQAVMEDLVRFGLAMEEEFPGRGFMVRCLYPMYVHFDPLYMPWNADLDTIVLAKELDRRVQSRVDELAKDLRFSPRQMNPAVFRLLQGGFARCTDEKPGSSPYAYVELIRNSSTLALAEGRASLPPIAPRAQARID